MSVMHVNQKRALGFGVFVLSLVVLATSFQNCSKQPLETGTSPMLSSSTTALSNGSCAFNNSVVPNGQSVTAYSASTVASGMSCEAVAQVRLCKNGVLSGSFTLPSCSSQNSLPSASPSPKASPIPGPSASPSPISSSPVVPPPIIPAASPAPSNASACLFKNESFKPGFLHTFYSTELSQSNCKDSEVYYECVISNGSPFWKYVSHRGALASTDIGNKFKSCALPVPFGKCTASMSTKGLSISASYEPSTIDAGKPGYLFLYGYRAANNDYFGYSPASWLNTQNSALPVLNSIPEWQITGDGVQQWLRYIGNDSGVSTQDAEASVRTVTNDKIISRIYLQAFMQIPYAEVVPAYSGTQVRFGYGLGNTKLEAFMELERNKRFLECGTVNPL